MTPENQAKLKRFGIWATVAASVIAAIAGFNAAFEAIEPILPAHRAYARAIAGEVTNASTAAQAESRKVIRDLQIEQAEGKRDQAEEAMFKWNVELGKAVDENTKSLIHERLRELALTKRRLENQIETLNKARNK